MHQPGKGPRIVDKRGQTQAGQGPKDENPIRPWASDQFIPARGYALIECRFVGVSQNIHIPDSVHQDQQFAIIRAMGPGKHHWNGSIIAPEWEVGDFIYAAIAQGRKLDVKGRMMVVLGTEFIFGKFPDVPEAVVKQFQIEEEREAAEQEKTKPVMNCTCGHPETQGVIHRQNGSPCFHDDSPPQD